MDDPAALHCAHSDSRPKLLSGRRRDGFADQNVTVKVANLKRPAGPPVIGIDAQFFGNNLSQLEGVFETWQFTDLIIGFQTTRIDQNE